MWDIENIPPASSEETVAALKAWLQDKGLWDVTGQRQQLHSWMVAFSGARHGEGLLKSLDREGIEQVIASNKREAADRRLVSRLQREAKILPTEATTFVLISSDMDFLDPARQLKQQGFRVVLVTKESILQSEQRVHIRDAATNYESWEAVQQRGRELCTAQLTGRLDQPSVSAPAPAVPAHSPALPRPEGRRPAKRQSKGKLISFNPAKGFGFLSREGEDDLFFHTDDVATPPADGSYARGRVARYRLGVQERPGKNQGRPRAVDVEFM